MKKIFLALSFLFLTTGIFVSQADSEANAATIITDQIIPYPDGSYWTNMCKFIASPLEYATAPKTVWCQQNWGPTNLVGGYVSLIEGQVAPGYIPLSRDSKTFKWWTNYSSDKNEANRNRRRIRV